MFLYSYALLAKSRKGITASLSDIDIFPLAKIKSAGMMVLAIILGRKLHIITIARTVGNTSLLLMVQFSGSGSTKLA